MITGTGLLEHRNKFVKSSDLKELCEKLRSEGKKIVLTCGTFDLLHSGHAAFLLNAKSYGDVLIVGIDSNKAKRKMRGKGFPLIDQKNRAELIGYFSFVNYTVIVDPQNMMPSLKLIKPDVFYTLAVDWRSHLRKPEEDRYIKKYGGKVIKAEKKEPFVSASDITERVADLKIKEIVEYFFGKTKIDLSKGDWRQKRWSGLKTNVRSEALNFGVHTKELNLFSQNYFGQTIERKDLKRVGERLRKEGKKIVLTSGACDLIHAGHARFYSKAKEHGDVMVLAIPSNKVITKQKGRGRPIVDEYSRAELMGFFEFVDYTIIFDEDSVLPIIQDLKPDVFFTVNEGWNKVDEAPESKELAKWGGKVMSVPPQAEGLSSSKLIRKAAGMRVRQVFKEVLNEADNWASLKD